MTISINHIPRIIMQTSTISTAIIQFLIIKKSRTGVNTEFRVNETFLVPYTSDDIAQRRADLELKFSINGTQATAYTVAPSCITQIN